jgi:hypothetical protein
MAPLPQLTFCIAALATTAACEVATDLLPRTHTTSASPDGRHTAFVRQGLSVDPPDDHLYLGATGGTTRRLMNLAPDADWCRTIIWSTDSRKVGFLIRDQQLAVFDSATYEHLAMLPLVVADGYPGAMGARAVAFTDDGRSIAFERFNRRSGRGSGVETVPLPQERLSMRMTWAGTNETVLNAWVSVRLANRSEVTVMATPGADGLVRLPAIASGPFAFVHVVVPGLSPVAVLRDVAIKSEPLAVELQKQRYDNS